MSVPSEKPSVPAAPSALEIATLAAVFLPKIDLPENWQTENPHILQNAIGKPTGTPYPENPGYTYPPGWRTAWEVVCEEAVKRAQTLLSAAENRVRPEVQAWEQAGTDARRWTAEFEAEAEALGSKFDRIAAGRKTVPIGEALQYLLTRSSSEKCLRYWTFHMLEWAHEYNQNPVKPEEVIIGDQSGRVVDREEFPRLIIAFRTAWTKNGDAWQKRLQREGGVKTQRKRREKESAEGLGPVTGRAASKIGKAAKKHSRAGEGKK